MKYDNTYPDMKPIYDEQNGIIRSNVPKPCHLCEENTEYVNINYEAHFCSDDCLIKFENKIGLR